MSKPRLRPTASISSMKMIAGAFFFAIANRRLMRAAPRPANISTKELADWLKKLAPDSCATALASSVLPVPGGPWSRMPFGTVAPRRLKLFGRAQELDDLSQLVLGLFAAGDLAPADGARLRRLQLLRLGLRHQAQRPPDEEDEREHQKQREPRQCPVLQLVEEAHREGKHGSVRVTAPGGRLPPFFPFWTGKLRLPYRPGIWWRRAGDPIRPFARRSG